MAASVESRTPFLDHPFAEWVSSLPMRYKLRRGITKWVLRAAMKDVLPPDILSRKKLGFPVPIAAWLRGPWRDYVHDILLGPQARARGLFDGSYVSALVRQHEAGRNHSERLWSLLTFELWAQIFLDKAATTAAPAVDR
jgi:asparagine synthase (glutamine-hydrolysing)